MPVTEPPAATPYLCWRREEITKPVPLESLRKLALAGEQAGLTFEDTLFAPALRYHHLSDCWL